MMARKALQLWLQMIFADHRFDGHRTFASDSSPFFHSSNISNKQKKREEVKVFFSFPSLEKEKISCSYNFLVFEFLLMADAAPSEVEMELLDGNLTTTGSSTATEPAAASPAAHTPKCGLVVEHEVEDGEKDELVKEEHRNTPKCVYRFPLICDLMQGNVRSPFLLFATFAFLIGAALLFFVMLFITAAPVTRSMAFVRIPQSSVRFGQPLDDFSVLVRYEGGGVVPNAEVYVDLTPAEPLNLVLHARSHEIPARRVDCELRDLEGLDSYHHDDVDDMLCDVVPYNAVAVADSNGVAVFHNVTLAFGFPAVYDLTVFHINGKKTAHVSTTIAINFNVISMDVDKSRLYNFKYNEEIAMNATASFVWPEGTPLPEVPFTAAAISLPMNPLSEVFLDYVASHYGEEEATLLANATDSASPQCAKGICNITFHLRPTVLSSYTPEMSIAVFFLGTIVTACETIEYPEYNSVVSPMFFESGAVLSPEVQPPEKVEEGTPFSFSVTAMTTDTGKPLVGGMVFLVAERVVEHKYAHDSSTKFLLSNRSASIDASGVARFYDIIFSSSGPVGKYIIHASFGNSTLAMRPTIVESRVVAPKVLPHFVVYLQPYKLNTSVARTIIALVRDKESNPIPGKRLFMLPVGHEDPVADLEVVASSSDNIGVARILAMRMRWRVNQERTSYEYRLVVDGMPFGNVSVVVNVVAESSLGLYKGCHIFSARLVHPFDVVDDVFVFASNDITVSISGNAADDQHLQNTIRCCVGGGESFTFDNTAGLCVDGLSTSEDASVGFDLPIYRFNYCFANMVCFDTNCRDITMIRLPFVYLSPITAAYVTDDASVDAMRFTYVGLPQSALLNGFFSYRYAMFLTSMEGYDYTWEKTKCVFPKGGGGGGGQARFCASIREIRNLPCTYSLHIAEFLSGTHGSSWVVTAATALKTSHWQSHILM